MEKSQKKKDTTRPEWQSHKFPVSVREWWQEVRGNEGIVCLFFLDSPHEAIKIDKKNNCFNLVHVFKSFISFLLCVQDLLQLQYEGVAVMKMFDKAKVNVNLLIFLLNKKFYGK